MSAAKTKRRSASSKKATAKKTAPKKAAPKKAAPKKAAPKKSIAKKAAPKKAVPKKAAKMLVTSKADRVASTQLRELADTYYRGKGVPEDFVRARALYDKAANLGDERAISNMIFFGENGNGARWTKTIEPSEPVEVDLYQALNWARHGARYGMDHDKTIARLEAAISELEAQGSLPRAAAAPAAEGVDGQRGAVTAAVEKAKLGARTSQILTALAPSVRLVPKPASAPLLGGSRLGGLPDLAAEVEWPRGAKGPLSFVAQINLADASRADSTGTLPKQGLLSFFYDLATMPWSDDARAPSAIAVLHTRPGTALARRSKPADLVAPHKYAHVELVETPVECRSELTLPFNRTKEARALGLSDDETHRYMDHVVVAVRISSAGTDAFHRMLGHADPNQGDMTRRKAYQVAGKPDAIDETPDEKVEADAASFRLLLQIDTDEQLRSDWGSGRLFYWIREADLTAGRFERTVFEFQG